MLDTLYSAFIEFLVYFIKLGMAAFTVFLGYSTSKIHISKDVETAWKRSNRLARMFQRLPFNSHVIHIQFSALFSIVGVSIIGSQPTDPAIAWIEPSSEGLWQHAIFIFGASYTLLFIGRILSKKDHPRGQVEKHTADSID